METYSRVRSIKLKRPSQDHPFGFSVRGGHEHGTGVFVSSVIPKTIAHRQGLKIGDQILRVNGYPVSAAVHHECLSLMKHKTNLHLKVRSVGMLPVRDKMGEPLTWKLVEETTGDIDNSNGNGSYLILEVPDQNHIHHHNHQASRVSDTSSQAESRGVAESLSGIETKVYINMTGESGLGCCICKGPPERPGIFVQSTKSNGVAREAGLRPGDQILYCNGHSFHNIPFAEAVLHLKASKHLHLSVLKGAASDLFPGESSGYNSSASSLNGETHNLSMGGSHLTSTTLMTSTSGSSSSHRHSSGSDGNSIHSEVVVEQHEPPKQLSIVNEEEFRGHPGSLPKRNGNVLPLDRNMEWDEVEQVWRSAEKESLIIQVKGDVDKGGAAVQPAKAQVSSSLSSSSQRQQQIQKEELIRLTEERKKLEQEQKRLQEEAIRLEEEKRKFEEEKRKAAAGLLLMNETNNIQQQHHLRTTSSSSNGSNTNTGPADRNASTSHSQMGSVASRASSSSAKSIHSLHGALTQEILKRNERRENGNTALVSPPHSRDETDRLPASINELPPSGNVDQKRSLFTAVPIIDDEKRLQHEQLIEEFKRAHRKMFAHTLEEESGNSSIVSNVGTNGTGSADTTQKHLVANPCHLPNPSNTNLVVAQTGSSTMGSSVVNSHFPRGGSEPERESIRAKRIQKEVEHAKKMVEQRLVGVARQRLLRIERQHQECRETEREVSKHVVSNKKKKSPPPPPPPVAAAVITNAQSNVVVKIDCKGPTTVGKNNSTGNWTTTASINSTNNYGLTNNKTTTLPTLVEDCSIDQIEQVPPQVICNGQPYNDNYIKKAMDAKHGTRAQINIKSDVSVNGRPESPSPDYSNSPSPTPESETQDIELAPDKIVQMTTFPSVYSRVAQSQSQSHVKNGYHKSSGMCSEDEIINGLSRCQLAARMQNELIKSNGNNGVTIVVNGGNNENNSSSTNYTQKCSSKSNFGILKSSSKGGAHHSGPVQHFRRYETNSSNNNNNVKTISFGKF